MTRQEARRYIEQAEKDPGSVDREKLAEAIEALSAWDIDLDFSTLVKLIRWLPPFVTARGLAGAIGYIASSGTGGESDAAPFTGAPAPRDAFADVPEPRDAFPEAGQTLEDLDYIDRAGELLGVSSTHQSSRRPQGRGRRPGDEAEDGKPDGSDLEQRFRAAAANAGWTSAEIELRISEHRAMLNDPQARGLALMSLEADAARLEREAALNAPAPIGVDRDFVAQRQTRVSAHPTADLVAGRPAPLTTTLEDIKPRYVDGDELSPAGLNPEEITRIQSRLEKAGLLEPGAYWAGTWDTLTISAYRSALGMANASGRKIEEQIDQLIATLPESVREQRARAEAAKTFRAPPYMRPDKDALAQDVKNAFRARLGRDPSPADLAWGIAGLGDAYRQQYEAEVAAARAQFNAANDPLSFSAGGTIQAVDPTSSFRERLEQKFGPEIRRLDAIEDEQQNLVNVFNSLRTMGSLVG